MSHNSSIVKALFLCLVGLSACQAAPRTSEGYTDSSGATVYFENDREACTRSCNADYDRCGDAKLSQMPVGRGGLEGVLGGSADCSAALKTCLKECRRR